MDLPLFGVKQKNCELANSEKLRQLRDSLWCASTLIARLPRLRFCRDYYKCATTETARLPRLRSFRDYGDCAITAIARYRRDWATVVIARSAILRDLSFFRDYSSFCIQCLEMDDCRKWAAN